jgi:hypothetical protein
MKEAKKADDKKAAAKVAEVIAAVKVKEIGKPSKAAESDDDDDKKESEETAEKVASIVKQSKKDDKASVADIVAKITGDAPATSASKEVEKILKTAKEEKSVAKIIE